jgi:hypothetical protein
MKEKEVHIAKHVRVLEWLKSEIIDQVAVLFKGLYHTREQLIVDGIASLFVALYVLARRLGIPFQSLDQLALQKCREHRREGHQLEEWYGDLTALEHYLKER